MRRPPAISFFGLSPDDFERFVAELLRRIGFDPVHPQPESTPGFDIIAQERRPSLIGVPRDVVWGVQVKRERTPAGPSVLTCMMDEAAGRGVHALLLVSTGGFTPRTFRRAEALVDSGRIEQIELWGDVALRRRTAWFPTILKHYFGVNVVQVDECSGDEMAELGRLAERVSYACGVRSLDPPDLFPQSVWTEFMSAAGGNTAMSGGIVDARLLLDWYLGRSRPKGGARYETSPPGAIYDEYEAIAHDTKLGAILANRHAMELRRMVDTVRFSAEIKNAGPLTFEFVTDDSRWRSSHYVDRNEYTWRLPKELDLRTVQMLVGVRGARINGVPLRSAARSVDRDRIRVVLASPAIERHIGQRVQIEYTVNNVHPTKARSFVSSLHAPAHRYRFRLSSEGGFVHEPRVFPLFGSNARDNVSHEDAGNSSAIVVDTTGHVQRHGGVVFSW